MKARNKGYRGQFTYPLENGTKKSEGHVVIEATQPVDHTQGEPKFGDYLTQIQLLKFDDDRNEVRFAYWMRRKNMKGKFYWHYASQNSWTFSPETTWNQIKEAEEKGFFGKRRYIPQMCLECKRYVKLAGKAEHLKTKHNLTVNPEDVGKYFNSTPIR